MTPVLDTGARANLALVVAGQRTHRCLAPPGVQVADETKCQDLVVLDVAPVSATNRAVRVMACLGLVQMGLPCGVSCCGCGGRSCVAAGADSPPAAAAVCPQPCLADDQPAMPHSRCTPVHGNSHLHATPVADTTSACMGAQPPLPPPGGELDELPGHCDCGIQAPAHGHAGPCGEGRVRAVLTRKVGVGGVGGAWTHSGGGGGMGSVVTWEWGVGVEMGVDT